MKKSKQIPGMLRELSVLVNSKTSTNGLVLYMLEGLDTQLTMLALKSNVARAFGNVRAMKKIAVLVPHLCTLKGEKSARPSVTCQRFLVTHAKKQLFPPETFRVKCCHLQSFLQVILGAKLLSPSMSSQSYTKPDVVTENDDSRERHAYS
jgi:hypothetical protein